MQDNLLESGKIVNTFGVRGEVKIQPWADTPDFLTGFEHLYIDGLPVKVLSARVHKGCVIVALEGVVDIEGSIKLKNKTVSINREDVQLELGRHFIADLVGLSAIDSKTGGEIGTVTDVLTLPANNVYVVKGAKEILIPAVPEFVREININEGYISFNLIEGL